MNRLAFSTQCWRLGFVVGALEGVVLEIRLSFPTCIAHWSESPLFRVVLFIPAFPVNHASKESRWFEIQDSPAKGYPTIKLRPSS